MSYREIAAVTQLPFGIVMSRLARPRPFWQGALGGVGAALAASLAFLLLSPLSRSLMPAHVTDVVSTDPDKVTPWTVAPDVSRVVADLATPGYRLVGGRADYFEHQRAAVMVYEHGAHVINVFTWVAGGRAFPEVATRSGYHVAFWKVGNLQYCAVSDAGWEELLGLVRLLRDPGARDAQQ
ncbi:MAG TPA: hypothetical protein VII79_01615 [Candidatus Dormibacteraeota bacterium]